MCSAMRRMLLLLITLLCLSLQALAAPTKLVPVGKTVGIEIETDQVVVADFSQSVPSARQAGIKKGDIIQKIDGQDVYSAKDIERLLDASGDSVVVSVQRGCMQLDVRVSPQQVQNGKALGVLVRDRIAGLGTVTFYDPETGRFGALGHGVSDNLTGQPLQMKRGQIVDARVAQVIPGTSGTPGALRGILDTTQIGTVEALSDSGVFGTLDSFVPEQLQLPVAQWSDLHTGQAEILSTVSDASTVRYTVNVVKLDKTDEYARNLLVKVDDPKLLCATGGIVQGMSGSPIIQDGKLIGAITHVLIRDPTTGYGIFIGNMLSAEQNCRQVD